MAYMTIVAVVEVPDAPKFERVEPRPGGEVGVDLVEEGLAQFVDASSVKFLTAEPGIGDVAWESGADPDTWSEQMRTERKTTTGMYVWRKAVDGGLDLGPDDPVVPEGEGWRMEGAGMHDGVFAWFWVRNVLDVTEAAP